MQLGVNYTPRQGWFHSWQDFDPAAAAADMRAIASLGVDHVRIFPLWPLIQPNRGLIRSIGLDEVVHLIRIAGEHGLQVNVDALQGHLSSFDFLPAWLSTWHRRSMFTEAAVVESTAEYIRRLTAAVSAEPNLLGITVGNETNQFAFAPHPDPHATTPGQATVWLKTMLAAARAETDTLVTHSMYDAAWYDSAQPFGPEQAATLGDATVTHSWVFNGSARLAGPMAEESLSHAEYLTRLAAAWHASGDELRPLWLQEVGAPTTEIPRAEAPEFLLATIERASQVPQLMGITWWCSHDVSRDLLDFPEVEYDLGLFDAAGRLKPTGEAFTDAVRRIRRAETAHQKPVAESAETIIIDDLNSDPRDSLGPGGAVHRAWIAARQRDSGTAGPRLTLRSRLESASRPHKGDELCTTTSH